MSSLRDGDVEMNNTANNKVGNNDGVTIEMQTYDPSMDNNLRGMLLIH